MKGIGEIVWPEIAVDPADPIGIEKDGPMPERATCALRLPGLRRNC